MNRFYDTMMQLKTGDFNYFISTFGFSQSARIVNAVYGPFVAYLFGAILLISGNWIRFQLITSFFINIIGAFGVFRICKKLQLSDLTSTLCGCLFMTTYFLSSWNYNGSFTAVGAMLVPWVLYYGIEMSTENNQKFSVLGLGISMGVMLQTHVFSSLLVTMALLPFVIYSLIISNNRFIFISKMFCAVIIAITLSLNVWLGFLHVMGNNTLLQTSPMDLFINAINFSSPLNTSQINIGFILGAIYIGQIFIVFINWKESSAIMKIMTTTGALFLFLSSKFFPWGLIAKIIPSLQSTLQFPFRLQVIPAILLIVSFGIFAERYRSKMIIVAFGICVVISLSTAQNRISDRMTIWKGNDVVAYPNKLPENVSPDDMRSMFKTRDKDEILNIMPKRTPDYLPIDKKISTDDYHKFNPYGQYWRQFIKPNKDFDKSVRNGKLIVSWVSKTNGNVKVPIVAYKNTIIKKDGKNISYQKTPIGSIVVSSTEGRNTIEVSYKTPTYIKISIAISLIMYIVYFFIWFFFKLKKNSGLII